MPKVLSLSDAEMKNLLQNVTIELEDIAGFLEGRDLNLLDFSDIEECPIEVILQGLKAHREFIKENGGQDGNILAYQRNSFFDSFENPAAELVSGIGTDFKKIRAMDGHALKAWLVKYLEMLLSEKHF
jgi:hypothetical protein